MSYYPVIIRKEGYAGCSRKRKRTKKIGRQSSPACCRPQMEELVDQQSFQYCKCGNKVKYAGFPICETCWVNVQVRWHGKSQRARIH
jgi:hypothetical protein